MQYILDQQAVFQPTLPARGATVESLAMNIMNSISTHAPRTGSDPHGTVHYMGVAISTHAPRTGSDIKNYDILKSAIGFQPTLPARGATRTCLIRLRRHTRFQPTLPARGATRRQSCLAPCAQISTHAPRTGSDGSTMQWASNPAISTHAPRTGSDGVL